MATNPYVNKVIYGNDTVMDISDTTATEGDVVSGKTFYKANGARSTGTASLDVDWGDIGGNLQNQTDLYVALSKKSDFVGVERMIDDTVGWVGKNLADISKAEVGKNMGGNSNANHIRLGIPCESSKTYYFTISGTNSFYRIYYLRTATPPTGSPIVSTATAPQEITTRSTDKYIYLDFEKSSAATFADLENLKMMVYAKEYYLAEVWNGGVIYEDYHDNVDLTIDKKAELLDKATVGWVGKNKFAVKLADVKANNSSTGTWSGNTYTLNGITAAFTTDANDYITEIKITGTSTNAAVIRFLSNAQFDSHDFVNMIINGLPASATQGWNGICYRFWKADDSASFNLVDEEAVQDIGACNFAVRIASGFTCPSGGYIIYPMLRDASITDSTFEPYHKSVSDVITDVYGVMGENGAKNKLPVPYATASGTERNGVTLNYDADGVITLSGTASQITEFTLVSTTDLNNLRSKYGDLIVNGCDEGSTGSYFLYLGVGGATKFITSSNKEVLVNDTASYSLVLQVKPDAGDVTGKKLYPMIRNARDTDTTYQPYAMTNRELTSFAQERYAVFADETLAEMQAYIKRNGYVLFNASGEATKKLTNSEQSGQATGYGVYSPTTQAIEYHITVMNNSSIYAGRFNTSSVTSIKKVTMTTVV